MTPFYLGSFNRPGPYLHARGEGLTTCALDETNGAITRLNVLPEAENAMWLTRAGRVLWVATERYLDPGEITAFALSDGGVPARLGQPQSSHGGAICHIAITPNRGMAIVASYLGGVTVHALASTGEVAAAHQIFAYEGTGPNAERQEKPHPHQAVVSPDGKRVLVCDLGADKIRVHALGGDRLGDAAGVDAPAGSGPRHLAFHPLLPRLYLFGELDAKVHIYETRADGGLWLLKSHASLPGGFTGVPSGAAIKFHPSGKALTVSNRNSDTITIFAVDAGGDLALAACFSTQGKTPRDFALSPSGRWLLAINQDSDSVVAFELDPASGLPTGKRGPDFACGSPVCAVF